MRQVIVDGNNYMQIAIFAAKKADKGDPTVATTQRILTVMIKGLMSLFGEFSDYYVAWDSTGGTQWRKDLDDDYKAGREHHRHSNLVELTEASKDVFANFIFTQVEVEKSEADDLMYILAKILTEAGHKDIVLVTRDHDLIQTVQDGYACKIWDCVTKKALAIPPYNIVDYKALVGDSSDNLKGVPGIGDKTAKKMLLEGFDRSIIEETRKVVHIPSNPSFEAWEILIKEALAKDTN